MEHFASVWDAADGAEADQSLRALTSARIQAAPVWSFLAKASDDRDLGNRIALNEDRLRDAAEAHGVTFEVLAKSLIDDYRSLRSQAAFYVTDGGEKVGGPYDSKADAQDAIDGGDVSGDNLQISGGDSDGDGKDDADEPDSDGDGTPDDSDSDSGGNPFAKGGDSDGDDNDGDEDQDDAEGEPSDDNPFAKKESKVAARGDMIDRLSRDRSGIEKVPGTPGHDVYQHNFERGHEMAARGTHTPEQINEIAERHRSLGHDDRGPEVRERKHNRTGRDYPHEAADGLLDGAGLGYGGGGFAQGPMPRGGKYASLQQSLAALFPVVSAHNVIHQPGETVFVDHFMGHDQHEGRKGVWAQVVHSPGQHGFEDKADSHLLKPMAPGGTHFFHHFGGLQTESVSHVEADPGSHFRFLKGVGSYGRDNDSHNDAYPHKVYDSIGSAANHAPVMDSPTEFHHCSACDHVYANYHSKASLNGNDRCLNCGDNGTHENFADVLHDTGLGEHDGAGEAHSEDNYGDPYGRMDAYHDHHQASKTALADGVDPLQWVVETVPGGEGQAEVEAHHETTQRMAALVSLFDSTQE